MLRKIKAGRGGSVACAGGGGRAERLLVRFFKGFISNTHESRIWDKVSIKNTFYYGRI